MSQVIGMQEALKLFDEKLVRRAMADALNKGATHSKGVQSREVARVYNVNRSAVNKTILVKKASPVRLSGALVSISQRLELLAFRPRQDAGGIRVTIRRGQPKVIPSGFINVIAKHGGKRGAALRKPGTQSKSAPKISRGPRAGQPVKRQEIKLLYGPAVAHLTDNDQVIDGVIKDLQEFAPKFFDQRLRKMIEQQILKNQKT